MSADIDIFRDRIPLNLFDEITYTGASCQERLG